MYYQSVTPHQVWSRKLWHQDDSAFWNVWSKWIDPHDLLRVSEFLYWSHGWLQTQLTWSRLPHCHASICASTLQSSIQKMSCILSNNTVVDQICWARFSMLGISIVITAIIMLQNLLSCFSTDWHSFRCFQSKTACLLSAHKQGSREHHHATSISLSFLRSLQIRRYDVTTLDNLIQRHNIWNNLQQQ